MGEKRQRKSYTNQLKARVALEAIKGQRTINEIASDYELHPNLVNQQTTPSAQRRALVSCFFLCEQRKVDLPDRILWCFEQTTRFLTTSSGRKREWVGQPSK